MVKLSDYNAFAGRHPETGTVHNALAYQGVRAPHTGEPYSEALLLGITGGITVGYFTFEYEGYLPHIALLTRNTFDPLETLFERLALPREVIHTTSSAKGDENVQDVLRSGRPAVVWADMFSLSYNDLPYDERNWRVIPMLVYGLDDEHAHLADRANVPIAVPTAEFQAARARIKKDKFRVMTLETPNEERLAAAVSKGIWECISLFTDAPPKGKRDNFGLAALQHWVKMLTNKRNKSGWMRYFAPGERLWMALAGNITQPGIVATIMHEDGNSAERGMCADFLEEAALILEKPDLNAVAALFRDCETKWSTLATIALPQDIPLFKETADLLRQKQILFLEQGAAALPEIQQVNARLNAIQRTVADAFPLGDDEVTAFFEQLAEQVLAIHDCEQQAVEALQAAMA